jgi:hypothetical protein
MPDITTSIRVPRYASAPGSPSTGQLYYDTTTNRIYFYDGTSWRQAQEVWTGTSAPSPRGDYAIWIDTT